MRIRLNLQRPVPTSLLTKTGKVFVAALMLFCWGCKKSTQPTAPIISKSIPSLTTTAASNITRTTANSGGNVSGDGGSPITAIGICYSTTANPTVGNSTIVSTPTTGGFLSNIIGLSVNTTYYVRAYATNSIGTAYGNEITFTTNPLSAPAITSNSVISSATSFSAKLTSNVTDDGGSTVTNKGICYSTVHVPTISDSKTSDGNGNGSFNSLVGNLNPNTTYFLRAYATNSIGTAYGDSLTIVTDIDGNVYNTVKIGKQLWMLENLKVTKLNNGVPIQNVQSPGTWLNGFNSSTLYSMFCWYNNNPSYKDTTGALYNGFVANTGQLAPIGWHVASKDDWLGLISFLDPSYTTSPTFDSISNTHLYSSAIAGPKMQDTGSAHWNPSKNKTATNSSRFSAFAGGERSNTDGTFHTILDLGGWWCSTMGNPGWAYMVLMGTDGSIIVWADGIINGYSVRCIKD